MANINAQLKEELKTLKKDIFDLEFRRDYDDMSNMARGEFHNRNIVPKGLRVKEIKEMLQNE